MRAQPTREPADTRLRAFALNTPIVAQGVAASVAQSASRRDALLVLGIVSIEQLWRVALSLSPGSSVCCS